MDHFQELNKELLRLRRQVSKDNLNLHLYRSTENGDIYEGSPRLKRSDYIFTFNDILEYELFRPYLQAMSSSGLNSCAEDLAEWTDTQENLRAHEAA